MKMTTYIVRLSSVLASLIATPSIASTWIPVSKASDGTIWRADVESIKDVTDYGNGQVRRVWINIDYSKVPAEPARESKVLFFFKCGTQEAKSTVWVNYRANGSVLRDLSSSYAVYRPAIPESMLYGALEAVCEWKTTTE